MRVRRVEWPKCCVFFSLPRQFSFFLLSLGSSCGILAAVQGCGPPKERVWASLWSIFCEPGREPRVCNPSLNLQRTARRSSQTHDFLLLAGSKFVSDFWPSIENFFLSPSLVSKCMSDPFWARFFPHKTHNCCCFDFLQIEKSSKNNILFKKAHTHHKLNTHTHSKCACCVCSGWCMCLGVGGVGVSCRRLLVLLAVCLP